jgi:hypothetical protein
MFRMKTVVRLALLAGVVVTSVGLYARDLSTAQKPRTSIQISAPLSEGSGPTGVLTLDTEADSAKSQLIEGPFFGEEVKPASFDGDVRSLPAEKPAERNVPELNLFGPETPGKTELENEGATIADPAMQLDYPVMPNIPAPSISFKGLDYQNWGAGFPPDTHGDVGPNHYIQAVNNSMAIYDKATGNRLAAFTFNTLFSGTSTPCDDNNNGDPVVIYDHAANRWIVTDFAWTNVDNGPYYECFAVSKTGDPVSGGWWFYGYRADDATHPWLADYPKFGNWPDALYMSMNMFDCSSNCSSGPYKGSAVYAFNKSDMFSGAALRSVRFYLSTSYFSLLPSHWRTANPPSGAPNYFVANSTTAWALEVWKFAVNWTTPANSTFTGPTNVTISSYTMPPATVPSSANALETLSDRLMTWNHYANIGGTESLWIAHTAGSASPNTAGIRWYQLNVTGGTIATSPVQQSTYKPDSTHRFIPSLAVDKNGNMAVGFSASASGTNPSIRYAGRLASDPLNALSQGEATMITGGGSQSGNCGTSSCTRWGDYASMSIDPVDSCTFWFTTEYYETSGLNWQTRIGSFKYPSCTSGTPTATPVPPTATRTPTGVPPTATRTPTSVPPTATRTPTSVPPTATRTPTGVPPTATRTPTSVPPTATRTPTPGSNIVVNPGFESGTTGWTQSSSGGYQLFTTTRPRTGSYSADLCGYNSCTEYFEQTVTVPSGANLKYWWYMTSSEGTTTAYDYLYVRVYSTSGSLLATLRTWSNKNTRNVWAQDTLSLAAYAGQTVKIRFTGTTDASVLSQFFVDDVAIP